MNHMQTVRLRKICLNFGAGKDQSHLEKGIALIKHISGITPIKTVAKKRIPAWGIRPGLPIGCKITLRNEKAKVLLEKLLKAIDNKLKEVQFDNQGNVSFGIKEYIDIPDAEYDPKIGILGLEVCVTLEKPGLRVIKRKLKKGRVPGKQRVSKTEGIEFMRKNFGVEIV